MIICGPWNMQDFSFDSVDLGDQYESSLCYDIKWSEANIMS